MYDYRDSRSNIINILKTETKVIKSKGIPKNDDAFTYKNAYKSWTASIFIDIKDSTKLFKTKDEKLARLMRAFTSEIITIFQDFEEHRQIGIRGDCVYAIYDVQNKDDLVEIFRIAYRTNTFMKMFNEIIKDYNYKSITAGIGLGCDEELIIKAGRTGTGVNDKIWIGQAVVDASNLSSIANRNGVEEIAMSKVFYDNIIDILKKEDSKYATWIKYHQNSFYHCSIIQKDFNKWIDNRMKG
ncbi:MAG: hypothetical protein K2K48_05795 [Anaeroplasmataceae bacterium]|nr:hypothetical protein [Anaeroplasmataceae bacterium]MDE6414908.1 hypothetical protein [Anaeroplasmataceae bacterium]